MSLLIVAGLITATTHVLLTASGKTQSYAVITSTATAIALTVGLSSLNLL